MPTCSVFGCTTNSGSGHSLHCFPNRDKSPKRFSVWCHKMHRKNFVPTTNARVCSKHFVHEDFDESDRIKASVLVGTKVVIKLKRTAIPSQQLKGMSVCDSKSPKIPRLSRYVRNKQIDDILSSSTSTLSVPESENKTLETMLEPDIELITDASNTIGVQCELGIEVLRDVVHSIDNSSDSDETYEPPDLDPLFQIGSETENCNSDSSDDNCDDNNACENNSFLPCIFVFWSCLTQLFRLCRDCGSTVVTIKKSTRGACVRVTTLCQEGHNLTWDSQPKHKTCSIGNVMIGSALTLAGIGFQAFKIFAKTLRLQFFSRNTYDKIINSYIYPTVSFAWESQKKYNLDLLHRSDRVRIAGDGQFDSPGFCAKYVVYSIMDLDSQTILDFIVLQRGQVKGDLEKAACEQLINRFVHEYKLPVKLFLSDRHRGVRFFMRTQFPDIDHEFDVWHMSKNLMKRLKGMEKKFPDLYAWKSSINNHLWWASQTCCEDAQLLIDKFTSILKHVRNIHKWAADPNYPEEFAQCHHDELSPREKRKKKWLKRDSEDFQALTKIVNDPTFLSDLKHTRHYVHTGVLESYHNIRLKYTPKRVHFSYKGMVLRSILAILDHNANLNRNKAFDVAQYSKASKSWILKSRKEAKSGVWRDDLMSAIHDNVVSETNVEVIEHSGLPVPQNIAPVPRPSMEELRLRKFSRFKQ